MARTPSAGGVSNGAAAILSVLLPGLGQMCQGAMIKGFAWLVAVVLGYCAFVAPGLMLHVICVVNAARR